MLFEPSKESAQAVFILFQAFSGTDNLTASVFIDINGNGDKNILDFTTSPPIEIKRTVFIRIAGSSTYLSEC